LAPLASTLSIDGPAQEHNFCSPDDAADWTTFKAMEGGTYTFETRDLGPGVDTVLTLYDTDAATPLLIDDDGGEQAGASRLRWTSPTGGQYYIRVHDRQGRTGEHTGYKLGASAATQTVRGEVRLQGREAFGDTRVTMHPVGATAPVYTATTSISGTFALAATLPCTVTASHPGYLSTQWALADVADPEILLDPVVLLAGDINGDRSIDILDIAYMAARFEGTDPLADLNGDGVVNIFDLVLAAVNYGSTATHSSVP
jgi:hypothetical protein